MFSLSLSLPVLYQIRNAWVAFTINKTKTTQVTGSALISVTWESLCGDFRLLSCIFRGDFFPTTFNYDYWGSIPPSRQSVLFNLCFTPWLSLIAMIKTCRKTANVHHVLFYLTMNNGHLISNGTGTERSFWMWRRQKEEREKNNHYPKTCSVMSETLFSPAKSPGALLRKYSGFVIEMWMADREDVTDLSKTTGVRETFWHLWEREKSCILGLPPRNTGNNTRLSVSTNQSSIVDWTC